MNQKDKHGYYRINQKDLNQNDNKVVALEQLVNDIKAFWCLSVQCLNPVVFPLKSVVWSIGYNFFNYCNIILMSGD